MHKTKLIAFAASLLLSIQSFAAKQDVELQAPTFLTNKVISRAGSAMVPLNIEVAAESGSEVSIVMAYRQNGSQTEIYGAQKKNGAFNLQLPEATYNFIAVGTDNSTGSCILLFENNVECSKGKTVRFNTADATHATDVKWVDDDGNPFAVSSFKYASAIEMNMIRFNGDILFAQTAITTRDFWKSYRTNNTNPGVDIIRSDAFATPDLGVKAMGYKVDLSAAESGTAGQGWLNTDIQYQPTPANVTFDNIINELRAQMPGEELTMPMTYWFAVYYKGMRYDRIMTIVETLTTGRPGNLFFWMDPELSDLMLWLEPEVNSLSGYGVKGRPVRVVDGELQWFGLNLLEGYETVATASSQSVGTGNPFFNKPVTADTRLANCAPAFFSSPRGQYVNFTFQGRYGENMAVDAFNIYDVFDDPSMFGGTTNNIILKKGDQIVTTNRKDYPSGIRWENNVDYILSVTTDNILIDGEIPGTTTAEVKFNRLGSHNTLPCLTALTMLDADGNVRDRFENNTDGSLALYCSSMKIDNGSVGAYYEYSPVGSIKVEYAPTGAETWAELPVKADPSLDYVPGFGNFYGADFAAVQQPSSSGWYDLRITLTNPDGYYQTQTISPAVKINSVAGVGSITGDGSRPEVIGTYNLLGRRIDHAVPGTMVIERLSDGSARKVIVR